MSISRRHFILGSAGAAAGLILPSYYQQALEFIDRTGKPLLKTVERPSTILTASIVDWGDLQYNLAVGADPYAGPPLMTLAEFVNRYEVDPYERLYEDLQEGEEPDWEAEVDWGHEYYFDTWMYRESPDKLAYELLKDIDLGPRLLGDNSVGEIRMDHGHTMVSSYWNVEAADEISLSLLQERLNALGTGIQIVMG